MVTVADLQDQTGASATPGPHSILYCQECGSEYSANKGDYWNHPSNYPFYCCGLSMLLVQKKVIYSEVKPSR